MGLNFRKSITLFKGVKLNLSKSGPSLSFGKSGLRQSINLKGQSRTTVGIPGTGIYYTKTANVKNLLGDKDKKKKDTKTDKKAAAAAAATAKEDPNKEANEQLIAEYEAGIEALKSIHKMSDGYIDWETIKNGAVTGELAELKPFAESILAGDIDSYFKVIEEIAPFDDLLDFGSSFEVGTDDPSILEVEFNVKSADVLPTTVLSLKKDGSISEKDMTKTAYYDLMHDYVSSTILRVARDTFALLPVKTVLIHAQDAVINPATGNEEEITLVSAKIKRDALATINFERIDPSDCLNSFECKEKFRKTEGYAPIDRILP
ncbi:MAG: DUF4236 domain-containing protein [Saccharofermentans sp.]|nr:DUF4236 domain-containing protein [Saccharofermentans sp.]